MYHSLIKLAINSWQSPTNLYLCTKDTKNWGEIQFFAGNSCSLIVIRITTSDNRTKAIRELTRWVKCTSSYTDVVRCH